MSSQTPMTTMSTNASGGIGIDNAVESACKLFLNMRRTFEVVSESNSNSGVPGGYESDRFGRQIDFIEAIADATLKMIQDLRATQSGRPVDATQDQLYDDMSTKAKTRLARSGLVSASRQGVQREPYSRRGIELDIDTESYVAPSRGLKRRQTIGWIPNGGKSKRVRSEMQGIRDKGWPMGEDDVETRLADNTINDDEEETRLGGETNSGDGVDTQDAIEKGNEGSVASETLNGEGINEERLDRISGLLSDGKKCTVGTLWLSVSKKRFAEHKLEEDAAFARLLSGYDMPQVGEIAQKDYFEDFVSSNATFKEQIDWDKEIDTLDLDKRIERREDARTHATQDLVHSILNTVLQLKLAIDWNSKPTEWKTNYTDTRFEESYSDKLETMKLGRSNRDYEKWYAGERKKFKDRQQKGITARNWTLALYKEFGTAVLLDPRWNPSRFGKSNRSPSFATFLPYLMANLPMRRATSDELVSGKAKVTFIEGRGMIKYNAGTHSDNDVLLLTLVKFISKRNDIMKYVETFITKMRRDCGDA
ncbi:hypothetical protein BDN71DRAFT_1436708 [Pleurotus eryngii]|uniref:Uncharacterized protein n=1 Tax=Pleurotus eryngii TaxID=5323 RepID=A0A9P5ZHQ9_PLEER|nr:hypothetical protein BDN71DRAFT_1436708 [Pleurotus eryngii]